MVAKIDDSANTLVMTLDEFCRVTTPDDFKGKDQEIAESLSSYHPKTYTRGKYEMWFMLRFVDALLNVLNSNLEGKDKVKLARGPLGEKNAVKTLGPRLHPTPRSIVDFLERNLAKFADGA